MSVGNLYIWLAPSSVRESLRFALHTPVAALSSLAPKLPPLPPPISACTKGFPSVWKLFLLHSSLPEVGGRPGARGQRSAGAGTTGRAWGWWERGALTGTAVPRGGSAQTHPRRWLNTDSLTPPHPRGPGAGVWGGSGESACSQAPPPFGRLPTTLWGP